MTHKFPTKPDLTHTDRYDRFVAMTQQIGALANLKNFEKAFQKAFKSAVENVDCSRRLAGHRTKENGALDQLGKRYFSELYYEKNRFRGL